MLNSLNEPILDNKRPRRPSDSKLVGPDSSTEVSTAIADVEDDELPGEGRMDTHASLRDKSSNVAKMHAAAEVYPAKTEHVFNYLQVFTACVGAFGHGANDVSNAVAPFATVYGLYISEIVEAEEPVPTWVLAFGGFGIVVGLVRLMHNRLPCNHAERFLLPIYRLAVVDWSLTGVFGIQSDQEYRCRYDQGDQETLFCASFASSHSSFTRYNYGTLCAAQVTPARGFTIELSSATIIILGSVLSLPLSTTHCQVGATVGVGMLEGAKSGVNWRLFLKVGCAWVFTIVITGSLSGALYAWTVFSPSLDGYEGTREPGQSDL
jgi:sodium-dependent phosphate transporter